MTDFDRFLSADARVMRSSIIRQLTGLVNRPDVVSFAAGSPNPATFPSEQLRAIFDDLAGQERGRFFQYSVTRGNAELIEAVRARADEVQGIRASQQETILVSGSQQGLDFVGRVLLDPGDAVFVELPNYIGATAAFENFRARPYGVKKTVEGMDLDDLRRQIAAARADGAKPKLVYAIPNFQNPSGHTWSETNRGGLLEAAAREDLLILEDDAYGEIYFDGVDPRSLCPVKALDGEGRVLYLATFSKTLAPGLRVAWIFGPEEIVHRIELAKETGDLCSSTLAQKMILEFLRRGWMPAQLAAVRRFYGDRSSRLQQALEKHFGGLARWNQPRGGLFLWAELLRGIDTLETLPGVVEREKIAYIPGQPFFVDGSGRNTLRLSYSNVSDEQIDDGIARLGPALLGES